MDCTMAQSIGTGVVCSFLRNSSFHDVICAGGPRSQHTYADKGYSVTQVPPAGPITRSSRGPFATYAYDWHYIK